MGGRGGSSGLSGVGKAPEFQGSEKQVKWANDIVKKFLSDLKDDEEKFNRMQTKRINEKIEKGHDVEDLKADLEAYKTASNVIADIAKSLSLALSAGEVISRRSNLKDDGYKWMLDDVGISRSLGIYTEPKRYRDYKVIGTGTFGKGYDLDKMKSSKKLRNDFVKEALEYLKKNKHKF